MSDPYLYPGTDVLINNLGIKDANTLAEVESDYVFVRITQLNRKPLQGNYDFEHFCRFHKQLFQDVYPWAGLPRSIAIYKREGLLGKKSVEYALPENIPVLAEAALKKLREIPWDKLGKEQRVAAFSDSLAALWKVHSFREGNTRSSILFCCQFAVEQGLFRDMLLAQRQNAALVRNALVAYHAIPPQTSYLRQMVSFIMVKNSGMDKWKQKIVDFPHKTGEAGRDRETEEHMEDKSR